MAVVTDDFKGQCLATRMFWVFPEHLGWVVMRELHQIRQMGMATELRWGCESGIHAAPAPLSSVNFYISHICVTTTQIKM